MKSAFDVLLERGFIEQMTHEDEIKDLLKKEKITFYIGFDPTADSLTIGHFLTVMAMAHMQRAGHRPIALVGGGTGMVGDPTDRTEMRRVMTIEEIDHNVNSIKGQLSKFIEFGDEKDTDSNKAIMANNADWLMQLKFVPFVRDFGIHFSVNKMLTADSYRTRFEKGLSFFEFSYMLMQAYDFLELNKRYNCKMQLGGNDQWSNIIAGADLIRRTENKNVYGMTFGLLTTSDGKKMGKSQKGAVWLDKNKTTPYEFFQYWRNIEDAIVIKCLGLLTFLPIEEIQELKKLEGSEINKAKEILAYEVTKNVHSKEDADKALEASRALFSDGQNLDSIPTFEISKEDFDNEMNVVDLYIKCELIKSRSECKRLIEQGGAKIKGEKIFSIDEMVEKTLFEDDELLIQKGKKVFLRIRLV